MDVTYTPEAIAALVKAAQDASLILDERGNGQGDRELDAALRPFISEPSTWGAFVREMHGEGFFDTAGRFFPKGWEVGKFIPIPTLLETREAYRARYGVEPVEGPRGIGVVGSANYISAQEAINRLHSLAAEKYSARDVDANQTPQPPDHDTPWAVEDDGAKDGFIIVNNVGRYVASHLTHRDAEFIVALVNGDR